MIAGYLSRLLSRSFKSAADFMDSGFGSLFLRECLARFEVQRGTVRTTIFFILLFSFCILYGSMFAFMAPYVILPFLLPIVSLAALVIWVLPSAEPPIPLLDALFLTFLITLIAWPNYLALALPGLPWITVNRLIGSPLAFTFLICLSVSKSFRNKMKAVLSAFPWLWKLLLIFVGLQLLSIGFSQDPSHSISKFIATQFSWTAVFFVSCHFFLKSGRPVLWAKLIWFLAIFVGVLAVWEHAMSHVPWAEHIPGFLKIEDASVMRTLAGTVRAYTGRYRSVSTFSTALGLAEFLALALPFILHFLVEPYRWRVRTGAFVTVPFVFYAVSLTDARLGMVGCLLSLLGYTFLWAFDRWRRKPGSLVGPAITLAFPALCVAAAGAVLFVHRFRSMVLGDGSQQDSTNARMAQFLMGLPKLLSHPWGYGAGMGAVTLGYTSPGGMVTIDSYYLTILLEYGFAGFIVYFGMLTVVTISAGRQVFKERLLAGEAALFAPATLSLINFSVIKSVFSQDDNHALVFMIMGLVVALLFREQFRRG